MNHSDDAGCTALMKAAEQGSAAMVELLLEGGADRDLVNADGKTALAIAEENGHLEAVGKLKGSQ